MTNKKTVYLSACGIGLGHVGRLKPFARWLAKSGHNIYFTGYGEALNQLQEDNFPVHSIPEIKFYENPDGSFNSQKTSVLGSYLILRFMRQVKEHYNYLKKYKPALVVSDTSYSAVFAGKKYKMAFAPDLPIIFITNQLTAILPSPRKVSGISWFENMFSYLNIRIIGMADHVLIQDLPPPYTISTNTYPIPEWLQYRFQFIGFIIRKTPEELPGREALREKFGVSDQPLIFAPLAGPIGARMKLLELLKTALKDFEGKVIVTMGLYNNNINKQYGSVQVIGWMKDRFEVLKAADITIARPGLATIGDFLRFGTPSILIPTINHPEQRYNANSVERLGVGRLLDQQNVNKKGLEQMIQDLLDDTTVKNATSKMQKVMITYDGLKKVKSIIQSKLNI